MVCFHGGKEVNEFDVRCPYCGKSREEINNYYNGNSNNSNKSNVITLSDKQRTVFINIFLLSILGIWLMAGLFMVAIGIGITYRDFKDAQDYVKTTATFFKHTDCNYDEDGYFCKAIYTYEVDGVSYTIMSNYSANEGNFPTKQDVYYNPNNPSEAAIRSSWITSLIVIGTIIIFVVISIFIVVNIGLKKIRNKQNKNLSLS